MASIALLPVNAANTAVGGYSLYMSWIAIRNMRNYEDAAKRAAKYTRIAEDQLQSTRTTCAAGAVASLYSFLASAFPLIAYQGSGWQILIHSIFRAGVLVAARRHIASFWAGKQKLPGVPAYNEAIDTMNQLSLSMRYLILGAGAEAVLGAVKMVLF